MGKKEFLYSVLASIVAAVILDLSGVLELKQYLSVRVDLPVWSLILFVVFPIVFSILWFRNTKTPEHENLVQLFDTLKKEKIDLERALGESRGHTSSLEAILADNRSQIDALNEKLKEWESRGIKLWQESDGLEQIVNRRFGPEIVELDGKEFTGCTFEGSILKFKGTGPVRFNHDSFGDVRWVMDKPASEAFSILGAMYSSGMPEMIQLVEHTFDNIRKNADKKS